MTTKRTSVWQDQLTFTNLLAAVVPLVVLLLTVVSFTMLNVFHEGLLQWALAMSIAPLLALAISLWTADKAHGPARRLNHAVSVGSTVVLGMILCVVLAFAVNGFNIVLRHLG
jgi:hypothetical protein